MRSGFCRPVPERQIKPFFSSSLASLLRLICARMIKFTNTHTQTSPPNFAPMQSCPRFGSQPSENSATASKLDLGALAV
ncbi:uncharacterized [Tachysurus ichikawai]